MYDDCGKQLCSISPRPGRDAGGGGGVDIGVAVRGGGASHLLPKFKCEAGIDFS